MSLGDGARAPDLAAEGRALFEMTPGVCYLNTAYMAQLPLAVRAAAKLGLEAQSKPWTVSTQAFFTGTEALRAAFARLVNADPDGVAIIPAASYGVDVAARAVAAKAGQSIVVLADQFPSNIYPWHALSARSGARIVTVSAGADGDWTGPVLAAVDRDTAVVAIDNCRWTDGAALDLAAIGRRAREVGAAFVIDASQSCGALPYDVRRFEPDFFVTVGYKWLLGPYGLSYMYVAPRFRNAEPIEHNWINRRESEDFRRLVDYRDEYQSGARRFDVGQRAHFMLTPMALAALETVEKLQPQRIQAYLTRLTDSLAEQARALGLVATPTGQRVGHMLGLGFPKGLPEGIVAALGAKGIHVSARGNSLRVAPYVFNDHVDMDRLAAALRGLAA